VRWESVVEFEPVLDILQSRVKCPCSLPTSFTSFFDLLGAGDFDFDIFFILQLEVELGKFLWQLRFYFQYFSRIDGKLSVRHVRC
jgi:hypothetical protein